MGGGYTLFKSSSASVSAGQASSAPLAQQAPGRMAQVERFERHELQGNISALTSDPHPDQSMIPAQELTKDPPPAVTNAVAESTTGTTVPMQLAVYTEPTLRRDEKEKEKEKDHSQLICQVFLLVVENEQAPAEHLKVPKEYLRVIFDRVFEQCLKVDPEDMPDAVDATGGFTKKKVTTFIRDSGTHRALRLTSRGQLS